MYFSNFVSHANYFIFLAALKRGRQIKRKLLKGAFCRDKEERENFLFYSFFKKCTLVANVFRAFALHAIKWSNFLFTLNKILTRILVEFLSKILNF